MPKQAGHFFGQFWRTVRRRGSFELLAQTAAVGLPWLLLLGERGVVAYGALALVVLLWCCLRELRRLLRQP